MNDILVELTPPEIALWLYLSELEAKQGGKVITLPKSGPQKLYTRQHLKRILKSLEVKKYLAIITTPANQHQVLKVAMATTKPRLNIYVQAARQECSGKPLYEVFDDVGRTKKFRQPGQEDSDLPGLCAARSRENVQAAPQLSLSSKEKDLKALAEMDQEQLMTAVMAMSNDQVHEVFKSLIGLAPWSKNRRISEKAKLYAAIRFLQDGKTQALSKQAWVEGVAKRAARQMEQLKWSDGKSEGAGRSLSPGKCARG